MKEERPPQTSAGGYRLAGMGMELGGAVVGLCLLGYWIDEKAGTTPRWLLICAVLGLVGGMYNFIRQALRVTRVKKDANEPERGSRDR